MDDLPQIINGVYYLTQKQGSFSTTYTAIRKKEGRILLDDEVKLLPDLLDGSDNYKEWQLRKKTAERFVNYLKEKNTPLTILEIGCGNGWFTHQLASISQVFKVTGLDVNNIELEQAARIFNKENLEFIYADLFQIEEFFEKHFDIIVLNACAQYFSDFERLILKLQTFLKSKGEIHILDTPFYKSSEIEAAKNRTEVYYKKIGVADMSRNYFHHSLENVKDFEILYQPSKNLLKKLFGKNDSPFMWLRLITTFVK